MKQNTAVYDNVTIFNIAKEAHLLDTIESKSDKKRIIDMAYYQLNK